MIAALHAPVRAAAQMACLFLPVASEDSLPEVQPYADEVV